MVWTIVGLVAICLVTIATIAFPVWAAVDAVSHPEHEWRAIGRRHTTWVLLLVVGTLLFLLAGIVASIVYVARVRPELRDLGNGRSDDPSDTLSQCLVPRESVKDASSS